jgi:hypothetical protein
MNRVPMLMPSAPRARAATRLQYEDIIAPFIEETLGAIHEPLDHDAAALRLSAQ